MRVSPWQGKHLIICGCWYCFRIMRNALIEEGGSGVSLDREAYARSVEYWSKHVVVQDDDE